MTAQSATDSPKPDRLVRFTAAELGRLLRPAAVIAVLAVLLGQGLAPASKAAAVASDRIIEHIDLAASISSQLFALVATCLAVALLLIVGRDVRVPFVVRVLLVAQTAVVFVIAVPASRYRLPPIACIGMGAVACFVAMAAATIGIREPRTRALALVLALLGLGAGTRIVGAGLSASWHSATATQASIAGTLVTVSVVLHGIGLLVALGWLASRRGRTISVGTFLALLVAMVVSWAATGAQGQAPAWMMLAARFLDGLAASPMSLLPATVDRYVAVLGPASAIAVLSARRQIPSVVGALALMLTAGASVDMPGRAMMTVLAALATVLAAYDDRGMWEALLGRRLGQVPAKSPIELPKSSESAGDPPAPAERGNVCDGRGVGG